jgi:hypothetical protein
MMCEERAGFLFARACDQMSVWSCGRCGKPICAAHTRTTAEGQACITCARAVQTEEQARAQDQQTTEDTSGTRYTDTDDPYFYRSGSGSSGSREHYDADDRKAFDSSANQEPEGSWEQDPAGS